MAASSAEVLQYALVDLSASQRSRRIAHRGVPKRVSDLQVPQRIECNSIVCATPFQLAEALRWPNVGPLEGQGRPPSQLSMCKTAVDFDVGRFVSEPLPRAAEAFTKIVPCGTDP